MQKKALRTGLQGAVSALLVIAIAAPVPLPAQEPEMQAAKKLELRPDVGATGGQRLDVDSAVLLVLDRFTYGPRPGDVEALKAMGVKEWFHRQLNPDSIDDSVLEKRIAAFPAMDLPLDRLMEMYPTNNAIRASLNRSIYVPGGDAEKAIYRDQQQQYKDRQAAKKAGKDDANDGDHSAHGPEVSGLIDLPPDKRFKAICKLTLPQWRGLRQSLSPADFEKMMQGLTAEQVEALAAFAGPQRLVSAEDMQLKLMRDIYTQRQLQEVMVDFWLNHFNVYLRKSQQAPYYIASYVRKSIRPYALGNFTNLLIATATSPAMLNYLDNSESVGPHSAYALRGPMYGERGPFGGLRPAQKKASGLNENYARELMELHTIGVNGGYTQKDVTEVAKVFTGWTVDTRDPGGQATQATFDPSKHEPGDKIVLGHRIREDGVKEGFEVLRILASSPQCARFIATKLAVRFVSDTPPPAMIDRMTAAFLETHGDIPHVLAAMVNSPEFFTDLSYRTKVKTPQDFVVSAVRAAGSDVQSTAGLVAAISDLGMPIYGMQTPNGYSMKNEAWNSTTALVSRMNFALALATNRVAGVRTDFDALLGPEARTMSADEKTRLLEARLLHVPVSERTESLIEAETSSDPEKQLAELKQVAVVGAGQDPLMLAMQSPAMRDLRGTDTQAAIAAGLILGSPEFQRR